MAQSVEEVSAQLGEMMKQFAGFQKMLQSMMDSLDTIGTWQATADTAFDDLREKARGMATSLDEVTRWSSRRRAWIKLRRG
jgi:septation ring formation regulator EzrA